TSSDDHFLTTRWTRVVAARGQSPDAKQALQDLCALNYAPVLRFLRASGHDVDQAKELTHEFFLEVLEHGSLGGSDPARGRFRSYLLGALKHFVANRRVYDSRLKRGAGNEVLPLETDNDTHHGLVPAALRNETPETLFDREWALGVIGRSLARIEEENTVSSPEVFHTLKAWLSASTTPPAQASIAAALGMSEGALKVAIHRLRKRFREIVRQEVAQTLHDPSELGAEMQHLIMVLSA
ncbi:MAG: sigma-70 family RNA polymerase sigma factor, partial [Verrucomicrobiota bacterium]